MFLKKRKVNNSYYWSLAESYRQDGKVKQRIIQNLGNTEKAYRIIKTTDEYKHYLDTIKPYYKGLEPIKEQKVIEIHRAWCMPNKNTFSIKPIKDLLDTEVNQGIWIDPFANTNKIANITNDLNISYDTDYHMDALDFLKMFDNASVDGVLYDPPYSPRQVSECYKGFGKEVTKENTQASFWSKHKDEIARILKPSGKAICFGWNSQGIGKTRGFSMHKILIVAHGGHHNDTICTVEVKS